MFHENKDTLLALFYHEVTLPEAQKIREHLADCEDCRKYMHLLNQMDSALNQWPEANPLPDTFDRILATIPERWHASHVRPAVSARPIFNIAFAMVAILLLIYFVQSRMSQLPFWPAFEQNWLVQTLGSYGFVALVFFGLGAFITLALAPILYFDLNKRTLHI